MYQFEINLQRTNFKLEKEVRDRKSFVRTYNRRNFSKHKKTQESVNSWRTHNQLLGMESLKLQQPLLMPMGRTMLVWILHGNECGNSQSFVTLCSHGHWLQMQGYVLTKIT